MSNDNWHAAGMGASVICAVCFVAFLLCIAWGVACGITGNVAAICH